MFEYTSPPWQTTQSLWLTFGSQEQTYSFRVRACRDATLSLVAGGIHSDTIYDIIIGIDDNQKTSLWKNNLMLTTSDTPMVLSCFEDREFFVRWL